MNGRLYDPMLHRFLMPDNFVQDPYSSLSYNRYSYALNNPLMYFDPSGELTEDNGGSNWLVGLSILAASFIGNSYEDISSWVDGWWPDARNWIGKQAKSVGDAIARPFRETGRWFRNLFKGGRDRPAPEVYMASMPMNAGSGGPNNLPIFGTSGGGGNSIFSFDEAPKQDFKGFWGGANYFLTGGIIDGFRYDYDGNAVGLAPSMGVAPTPGIGNLGNAVKGGTTILGKFPEYIELGKKLNA
jgi:hypothetical protein